MKGRRLQDLKGESGVLLITDLVLALQTRPSLAQDNGTWRRGETEDCKQDLNGRSKVIEVRLTVG